MKVVFEIKARHADVERRKRIRDAATKVSFSISFVSSLDVAARDSVQRDQRTKTIGPGVLIVRPTFDPLGRSFHYRAIVNLLVCLCVFASRIRMFVKKA